MKNITHKIN